MLSDWGAADSALQAPNPASSNCVARGGTISIVKTPSGDQGMCRFPDGSSCEEWALFRGACKPGVATASMGAGATPWVAGGLILLLAIGVYALETKGPAPFRRAV